MKRLLPYVQAKALKINLPAANCGALAPTSLCLVKFWPQQAAGNEPVTDSRRITATSYQLFIDSSLLCICFFVNFFLYILFCIFFLYTVYSVYFLVCYPYISYWFSISLPSIYSKILYIPGFYIFQDSIYSKILYIPGFYISPFSSMLSMVRFSTPMASMMPTPSIWQAAVFRWPPPPCAP